MPRKRKRNAGLSVKKKSIKHNQKQRIDVCNENKISILNIDDRSVNLDNDNSDILIRNSSSSSSRGNFNISNVIDTIDTEKATHIVSEYDNIQEEDALSLFLKNKTNLMYFKNTLKTLLNSKIKKNSIIFQNISNLLFLSSQNNINTAKNVL